MPNESVASGEFTVHEREHAGNIEQNIRNYAAKGMLRLSDFWIGGSERVRSVAIDKLRNEGWTIEADDSGGRIMYTITPPTGLSDLRAPKTPAIRILLGMKQ